MYSKLKAIQSGSFSTVYKAWSSDLNREVALKVIPKSKFSENGMRNEYEVMKRLGSKHPNICSMLDFHEYNDYYILVLEYCECGDMYDFLDIAKRQGDSHSPSLIQLDFTRVVHQLISAIDYAHSLGISHRDIKPENVLLTKEGNVKLADWGHATISEESKDFHIGTDNYRAPETFNGISSYNNKSIDYWSLGVTLLYLIFGHCPFKNAAISNDESEEPIDREYPKDENFQEFLKDPHAFIYRFYLAPMISANKNEVYSYKNSQPTLYVWQDMTSIYSVLYLSRIIVDTLTLIEVDERSLSRCLDYVDKSLEFSNSQHDSPLYDSKDSAASLFLDTRLLERQVS